MAIHYIPSKRYVMPSLFTVRAYCDATFAGILSVQDYLNPLGVEIELQFHAPADAGDHVSLLWLEVNYAGTAAPVQRNVVFNRRAEDA